MGPSNYSFHRIPLVNVSAYLLYRKGEAILVDSGNAGSEVRILEEINDLGIRPDMIRLLILTHAHFDHAGSAARIRELCGCRVVVHSSEAERLRKGFTRLPPGTRWKARLLVGIGRTLAARMGKFPPVIPDILVDDMLDLAEYGFPGRIIHMPGHTRGSMIVLLDGGEMVAGDTVFGLSGKQHFPPFAEDLPALVESWKRIRELGANTIWPAHGKSVSWESFTREFPEAMRRYARGAR